MVFITDSVATDICTLFMTKVAETRGIDLNTVRGDEWD